MTQAKMLQCFCIVMLESNEDNWVETIPVYYMTLSLIYFYLLHQVHMAKSRSLCSWRWVLYMNNDWWHISCGDHVHCTFQAFAFARSYQFLIPHHLYSLTVLDKSTYKYWSYLPTALIRHCCLYKSRRPDKNDEYVSPMLPISNP